MSEVDLGPVVDALRGLIEIPSVSLPGFPQEPLERSAALVAALLVEAGLDDVQVVRSGGGRPAVLARHPAPPGRPTVLLYCHHDVQPAGDLGAWTSGPFEPVERHGRLYGRGAADNKAGIAVHLAALRALGPELPVGLVVLVEGEEEIGSPTLEALLDEHVGGAVPDAVVIADAALLRVDQPALTVSLRGLVDGVVELRTLEGPLHSGVFGGVVPDALSALARLLSTLHDEHGAVAVAGLDGTAPTGLALEGDALTRNAGAVPGVLLPDAEEAARRAWSRPAISVIGLDAPPVAEAGNQLLDVARAKISVRLPPGATATEVRDRVEAHLRRHVPWGAQLSIEWAACGEPVAVDPDSDAMRVAEEAFAEAWGVSPIRIGTGGTIPVAASLATRYPGVPLILFGAADRTSRTHAPDESVSLDVVRRCALAEALFLSRLPERQAD